MTPQEYEKQSLSTSNDNDAMIQSQVATQQTDPPGSSRPQLFHGIMGLVTESGELMDLMKRCMIYGTTEKPYPIDPVNVMEELGDMMWYIVRTASAVNLTLDQIMRANVAKLDFRYQQKQFSAGKAVQRDKEGERKMLEMIYHHPALATPYEVRMHKEKLRELGLLATQQVEEGQQVIPGVNKENVQ